MSGYFEKISSELGFRFVLKTAIGETVLTSETYRTRSSLENAIESVKKNAPFFERYELKESKHGRFFFNLKASNHQVIGTSQMYASERSARNGMKLVAESAGAKEIRDYTEKKPEHIGSVRTFLAALEGVEPDIDSVIFFRGHEDYRFELSPGIYRKPGWIKNESAMFHELKIKCPTEFLSARFVFDSLVKMQHYSLPTRLLDLTTNPLVALYFACLGSESDDGEVVAIKVPKSEIKYNDSDTVSLLSNLAIMPSNCRLASKQEIEKLTREVQREKPYFENRASPSELNKVVCVKPILDNPRIIKQEGAFLLFGVNKFKDRQAQIPKEYIALNRGSRLIIKGSEKAKIKQQIQKFGISESSIFPEIENVANHIKSAYQI